MSSTPLLALIARCRVLCRPRTHGSDAELLAHFVQQRDAAAFEELLDRHAPLVWGVCRRIVRNEADCEDAFQAVFLALVRQAARLDGKRPLGAWLHTVAVRVARKASIQTRRQRPPVAVPERTTSGDVADVVSSRELFRLVDEEIERLPARLRVPILLCCLQGRTRDEAAEVLGCSVAAIKGRLERGRDLLRRRLHRRGVQLPAALLVLGLTSERIRAGLWAKTLLSVRYTPAPAVAALAEATLSGLLAGKGKLALVLLLLATGMGGVLGSVLISKSPSTPSAPPQAKAATEPKNPEAPRVRTDRHGDPLPVAAIARLGTVRQRAPDSHLAVTADSKEIVAVGDDLTVRRFDAQSGELRSIRQLSKASSTGMFRTWLSPRGTFVLTAYNIGPRYLLDLWTVATGKIRQQLSLSEQNAGIFGAAFSADERRVAFADISLDRKTLKVLIWDLETSKSRVLCSEKKDKELPLPYSPIVVFSPDGKRLAIHHIDYILRCWDVESGKLLWQAEKKKSCPLLVFSADSRLIYTRLEVSKTPGYITKVGIDIRDADTGELLLRKKPPKEAAIPIGSSPDGRFIAFQTMTEEVVLWEPGKDKIIFRFPAPPHRRDDPFLIGYMSNQLPTNFAFTPDGKGFIRRAGSLQRWDLSTGKPVFTDTENWGHAENVTRLLFAPDSRWLASSSKDRTIRLWDVSTARTVHSFSKENSDHLTFTPDGRSLLTVPHYFRMRNSFLLARDVASGRPGQSYGLSDDRDLMILSLSGKDLRFTRDGKKVQLLSWNGDGSILMVWDAATGKCLAGKKIPLREWDTPESLLTPDGQSVLAFDSPSQTVRLLSLENLQPRWQLKIEPAQDGRHYYGCNLALSPNGRMMAARNSSPNVAGVRNNREPIFLADMATGRPLAKISTNGPVVFDFSTDNRLFAVAESAGIRLWETTTWRAIGFIPIANREIRPSDRACASSLAFSPDGRVLATGHADGTILLWDATLQGSRHGEPLTAAQRESLWTDLAGADAAKAYAAVGRLPDDPASSVSFLKERLKPVGPIPPDMLRSLLMDLDSDQFAVREAAEKKLRALGERVASSLREELKAKPSLEKRKRIEELLAGMDATVPVSGETLRSLRAVQVLERIGSAEARQLLEELSRGIESARQTQAANEALRRLKRS